MRSNANRSAFIECATVSKYIFINYLCRGGSCPPLRLGRIRVIGKSFQFSRAMQRKLIEMGYSSLGDYITPVDAALLKSGASYHLILGGRVYFLSIDKCRRAGLLEMLNAE